MITVYTINSELESAKKLGFETTTCLYGSTDSFNDRLIIRWGNSYLNNDSKTIKPTEFKNILNFSKNIALNCKKNIALKKLSEVVKTPEIYDKEVPKNRFAVYRPIWHSNGKDFNVKKGPFKIELDYYATRFIKTNKEYRVFYCSNNGGQFLMCRRVTYRKDRKNERFACRSRWSYDFRKTVPEYLKKNVKLAFDKIGLNYGAADILFLHGKYYFLELNSAPNLDVPILIEWFQKNIKELIKEKFPDFKKFVDK